MPSPIAHLTVGYLIYEVLKRDKSASQMPSQMHPHVQWISHPLTVALGSSMLPDMDSVAGIIAGDFGGFHNNASHSLVVGLPVALATAGLLYLFRRKTLFFWFATVFSAYEMHVIMDYFTVGRGVMLFWPFTDERFQAPISLFYGLKWSQGWMSSKHLWTLFTELAFAACVVGLVYILYYHRRKGPSTDPDRSVAPNIIEQ